MLSGVVGPISTASQLLGRDMSGNGLPQCDGGMVAGKNDTLAGCRWNSSVSDGQIVGLRRTTVRRNRSRVSHNQTAMEWAPKGRHRNGIGLRPRIPCCHFRKQEIRNWNESENPSAPHRQIHGAVNNRQIPVHTVKIPKRFLCNGRAASMATSIGTKRTTGKIALPNLALFAVRIFVIVGGISSPAWGKPNKDCAILATRPEPRRTFAYPVKLWRALTRVGAERAAGKSSQRSPNIAWKSGAASSFNSVCRMVAVPSFAAPCRHRLAAMTLDAIKIRTARKRRLVRI